MSVPGQSVEEEYNCLFTCGLIKTENRDSSLCVLGLENQLACVYTHSPQLQSGRVSLGVTHISLCSQVGKTTESEWLQRSSGDTGSEVTSSFGFARPETEVHTYHVKADLAL